MNQILSKTCEVCSKKFLKTRVTESKKKFLNKRFCSLVCMYSSQSWKDKQSESHKGQSAWNKGIESPYVGELSGSWKGTPLLCSNCGRTDLKQRSYHWANIDHKYRRVLDDFIRLCVQCHTTYDKEHGLK